MTLLASCCNHIHTWIETQVVETPEAIALIHNQSSYTYWQLNQQANQLAHYLRTLGVTAETCVGICIERSPAMIIAMLAVLKAGGAYVPIDSSYPQERISLILEDAQVSVLIVSSQQTAQLLQELKHKRNNHAHIVCLATDQASIAQQSTANLSIDNSAQLAYVIYTSGSTGKPKGVMIEHSSLVKFVQAAGKTYEISIGDRVLQFASISFDISVEEIFVTLTHGATLVLRSDEMLRSAATFLQACQNWQITVVDLPTAFWHTLCANLSDRIFPDTLRLVIIGGERAVPQWLTLWKKYVPAHVRLINTYGPTETTVVTTLCELAGPNAVELGDHRILPIGKPLEYAQTLILDEALQPVDEDAIGELYIGGSGLARGYFNRPDLTEKSYRYLDIEGHGLIRLYKTGDRVHRRPDNHLEFLGRTDNQQKIRGFRVELGEIESILEQHSKVREAIVLAREDVPGDKRLVAYVVLNEEIRASRTLPQLMSGEVPTLRSHMQGKLPGYMVPAVFVLLDTLPLSPNGKIDRRQLPIPNMERPAINEPYVAPRTPLEHDLVAAWSLLLGIEKIGINDNFFELGGNSLQTMELISYLEKNHKVSILLTDFLTIPSIAGIATLAVRNTLNVATEHMGIRQLQDEVLTCWDSAKIRPLLANTHRESRSNNHIFFTGGTGFLGSFLLQALLQKTPPTTKIYCLIRAHNVVEAQHKLRTGLEKYLTSSDIPYQRLIPVMGNLIEPYLGLSAEHFSEIARSTHAIYHSGANVNMFYPYTALKAANVQGTLEVIRLAATGPLKTLHHISTLDVFESLAKMGIDIFYENDDIAQGKGLSGGYAQSKWIAEQLVLTAQKEGLPVCLYRPGMISGHSKTGQANTNDVLCRFIQTITQLGEAPDFELMVDMTPVDYVSQVIAHLSTQPDAIGQTFHIVNSKPITLTEMIRALQANHHTIHLNNASTWLHRFFSETHSLSALAAFVKESTPEEQHAYLELWLGGHYVFDSTNTTQHLQSAKIFCPPADRKLLNIYLSYLTKIGFIPHRQASQNVTSTVSQPIPN
ncbi:MAG: amino acid adenylation domain-containing protein [Phormidesmis sp.]